MSSAVHVRQFIVMANSSTATEKPWDVVSCWKWITRNAVFWHASYPYRHLSRFTRKRDETLESRATWPSIFSSAINLGEVNNMADWHRVQHEYGIWHHADDLMGQLDHMVMMFVLMMSWKQWISIRQTTGSNHYISLYEVQPVSTIQSSVF